MNRAERRTLPSRADQAARARRRRVVMSVSLGLLAIVVIVAVALGSRVPKTASDAPIDAALAVGARAPEFSVSTTHGPFDLAQAGGKPTLLEVFATWCPHCQRETAVLNRLYAAYGLRANIVAVSGSPYDIGGQNAETQADVVAFAQKFHVAYPIAFDPDLAVAHQYLQGGFPSLVLIGRDRTVQAIRSGEIPEKDLAAALGASLAGRKPDPKMGG